MRKETYYFDVFPQIVRTGRQATITVRPRFDHCRFREDAIYRVSVIPAEGRPGHTVHPPRAQTLAAPVGGTLQVQHTFEDEGEHVLLIETIAGEKTAHVADLHLYALEDDLFARLPYKGDVHIHSSCSDGMESPAYVAGACRRIGLDFMALTDHRKYAPSLEAIAAFAEISHDLCIYPGEEVHPPGNPVHIVNFGGRFSINDLFATDAYRAEVRAIEAALADLPAGADPYPLASCIWCYDKIREAGGLGVFCHPDWFTAYRYDVPAYLTELLFERQPFDAMELVGGYPLVEVESNRLQVARYQEERARGRRIPVVGVSDAHGCERGDLFGWYYTVAFAPSAGLPDLIGSIKDLYSVAVEAIPGAMPRAFGPFRLVKYTQFLLREIFPQHDELCLEEGRLMLAHVAGDRAAAEALADLQGRTAALYRRLWGV
jgi:hypothetical protein